MQRLGLYALTTCILIAACKPRDYNDAKTSSADPIPIPTPEAKIKKGVKVTVIKPIIIPAKSTTIRLGYVGSTDYVACHLKLGEKYETDAFMPVGQTYYISMLRDQDNKPVTRIGDHFGDWEKDYLYLYLNNPDGKPANVSLYLFSPYSGSGYDENQVIKCFRDYLKFQ